MTAINHSPIADLGTIAGSTEFRETKVMRWLHLLVVVCLAFAPASCHAGPIRQAPAKLQLRGLNAADAAMLIAKLERAQSQLRAGVFQSFELLGGSIASNEKAKVSPYDAFLAVKFKNVWEVERGPTDNRLWQPYKLAYVPPEINALYWDIEVVLGVDGSIERVTMIYKSPAPF